VLTTLYINTLINGYRDVYEADRTRSSQRLPIELNSTCWYFKTIHWVSSPSYWRTKSQVVAPRGRSKTPIRWRLATVDMTTALCQDNRHLPYVRLSTARRLVQQILKIALIRSRATGDSQAIVFIIDQRLGCWRWQQINFVIIMFRISLKLPSHNCNSFNYSQNCFKKHSLS